MVILYFHQVIPSDYSNTIVIVSYESYKLHVFFLNIHIVSTNEYLLLTEFEVRTVNYRPSFFPFDLWPKREARGP